jgi:hypothetical protein
VQHDLHLPLRNLGFLQVGGQAIVFAGQFFDVFVFFQQTEESPRDSSATPPRFSPTGIYAPPRAAWSGANFANDGLATNSDNGKNWMLKPLWIFSTR